MTIRGNGQLNLGQPQGQGAYEGDRRGRWEGLVLGFRIVGTNNIKVLSTVVLDTEHPLILQHIIHSVNGFAGFEKRKCLFKMVSDVLGQSVLDD